MTMLSNRALLVSLSLGTFDPKRKDKGLTREFASQKGADTAMLGVTKRLFPEDAAEAIRSHDSATRLFFHDNTSPFTEGLRLLDIRNFDAFMGVDHQAATPGIRQRKSDRTVLVSAWASKYAANVDRAKAMLGDTFRADQYPAVDEAAKRFTFEVETYPVPEGGNLALNIAAEELESLQRHFDERNRQAAESAYLDMLAKLADPLCRFARRVQFQGDAAAGVKSLWQEMRDLVDRLPRINITDNPKVEELRKALATDVLDTFTPEQVIEDDDSRDKAKENVRSILERMKGYAAA